MAATRQIALLRGINVGRAKRVAMADLRALCESLGYREVITLLNSGNVIFSAPTTVKGDHAARIEKSIASRLGVVSRVIVLSDGELAGVMKGNVLHDAGRDPARLL